MNKPIHVDLAGANWTLLARMAELLATEASTIADSLAGTYIGSDGLWTVAPGTARDAAMARATVRLIADIGADLRV